MLIELHHPDRGGDPDTAKRINASYDELRGQGSAANEYVAANYNGEPWVVLGLSSAADARIAGRAAKQLAAELESHPKLAQRVAWAAENFGKSVRPARIEPLTPPPRRPRDPAPVRAPAPGPVTPGMPSGLPASVDFGTLRWGDAATKTVQLTWKRAAPFDVSVEAPAPVRAQVTASKVLPGRFSVELSIDWDSPEFSRSPATRGYSMDVTVTLRWMSRESATFRAKGVLLYPPVVSASPVAIDLGTVMMEQPVRTSVVLVSTAPAEVTVAPTPWLQRVDGNGRVLDGPLPLKTNVPVRVELRVYWPPITERGAASLAAGKPVRPTGTITVRWGERSFDIQAQMVVQPKRR